MSTEIMLRPSETLQLTAVSTDQTISAHTQMRIWIEQRIRILREDLQQEIDTLGIAVHNKWAVSGHRRKIRGIERRIDFFNKIDAALAAGYVIVPNFNMDIFAIRTDRKQPARNQINGSSWNVPSQDARVLPLEEGEYRSPLTMTETDTWKDGDRERSVSYAVGNWLPVEFPFALAKPLLMNATAEAMALKCFDEIGVVTDRPRVGRGDPFVIGRILNPAKRADLSFFIGWFFDPSAL